MDDNLSIKSSDSCTTSGEYEIVPEVFNVSNPIDIKKDITKTDGDPTISKKTGNSPKLYIANNGDFTELEKNMNEVIHDLDSNVPIATKLLIETNKDTVTNNDAVDDKQKDLLKMDHELLKDCTLVNSTTPIPSIPIQYLEEIVNVEVIPTACFDSNKVGQSVFYDCVDSSPVPENQDVVKMEKSDTDEEMSDIDQDCTIFSGVTYLGAASINAPKSQIEIHRNMSELNANSERNDCGLKVAVSIPTCLDGLVVLYDAHTKAVIAHYEVHRILFYARGVIGSSDQACFSFTWSHGESQESAVFQCHVFKCQIPEAVTQVSTCFAKAFQRIPASLTGSVQSADNNSMVASITDLTGNPISSAEYEFIVTLEIRERVAKNSYSAVPRDRSCFKLRCNTDKEVSIMVKQTQSTKLSSLYIERCFGVLLSPGKLVRQADMQLLDMVSMGYEKNIGDATQLPIALAPYIIRAEWKANDRNFEQLNLESIRMHITVAVDLVIKGIQEPVRFVIETPVSIQSQNEIRIMDFFANKKSMMQRFYLQLKENGDGGWEVQSIDPSEEIIEPPSQSTSILKNFGINSFSRMVRSQSAISIEQDECLTDYSSDGDEPLLSGTGEVSKDCSQDTLDEWGPVLQEWIDNRRPKNVGTLVRLGIPEALRGKVWQKLSNVDNKIEMTDNYRVLLTKETNCETVIMRDIHRTFPAHTFFRETGGSGQDALFKVSKAYAVYDSEVGYCQGLSFISASLLLHMPEEEAFCVLVALMYDYGLRDLYKHGFECLYLRLFQLNRLMRDQLPRLFEHFEQIGIETHMFASQWFLTLFTARFPLYFVFHILDLFLLDGMPILFQVALTLLSKSEQDLRQLDFEGVLKYVRVNLPKKCRSSAQARKLIKQACERKVKKLKQYEDEFLANKDATEKANQTTKEYELRFTAEREQFKMDTGKLQLKLDETMEKTEKLESMHENIVRDYKQIIQRQEQQITKLNEMLEDITKTVSKCSTCAASITPTSSLHQIFGQTIRKQTFEAPLGPLDPLNIAMQRIRELELELAQTKLAHVEAECKNQDLNHQLNTTLTEIQSNNRNSWQPWLSKTFNTIQEKVAQKRDQPTFQSYTNPIPDVQLLDQKLNESPTLRSHRSTLSTNSKPNSLERQHSKKRNSDQFVFKETSNFPNI